MNFGLFEILTLVGSLGFFIYGMKIMSEGIQILAGAKMRSVLGALTNNKFAGVLTGFFTTSVIQSSSATTVMIVSFVNAGLLSLRQAIGVIMGANIGTTVTAFLVLGLGFGKLSLATVALPLIAIGLPLIFFKRDNLNSLGDFVIGFALLFMGLEALKSSVPPFDQGDFYNLIEPLTRNGIFSVIIFVFIGTLVTIIVQSSSAAMALTLVLCTKGLSFEFAAAIVLGENIGTTITANIAAIIGNIHAKRAALAHLIFNLIGVLWMLVFFYFFTENIEYIVKSSSDWLPFDTSSKESIESSTIQWSLALFHLTFNILNTLFLVWFIEKIESAVVKVISSKADDDEIYQLKYISNNTYLRNTQIEKLKEEAQIKEREAKERLEEKNKEIVDSINYAKRIQDAMMTSEEYRKSVIPKSFTLFKPKDVVSGDFYWVYKDQEENIFFTVADCTGHGVPGAFMSMIGISLLNEIIVEKGIKNTNKVLDEMRTQIIKSLNQADNDDQKDGMDISLCKLNFKKKTLEFSGAHNPLLVVRNNDVKIYKGDSQAIGLETVNIKPFTKHAVKLQKNDMIYIYSDGYQDQFGGKNGKKYMAANFKKLLLKISEEEEKKQNKLLEIELANWMKTEEQIDDICIMGVRV